jgi:hypothetical protein
MPIGWGKCYNSESVSQILTLINFMFGEPGNHPQFVAYDNACQLLAYIITQNLHDTWIETTQFIVDAWHYINHDLCQTWCNPAPLNGSQPDLVIVEYDAQGYVHSIHAFNTETAEQFNSWMDGYEAQLCQMTDVNVDFFIHSVLHLYKEVLEGKMADKSHLFGEDDLE